MRPTFLAVMVIVAGLVPLGVPAAHATSDGRACRPTLRALHLPGHLHVGESARGRITLSCAPAAAVTVTLRADVAQVKVPASLRVRAGHRSARFSVTAKPTVGSSYDAKVTARRGGSKLVGHLGVTPGLKLVEIPQSSRPNDVGLDVLFTGSVPAAGATVRLSSSSKAVTVPPTAHFTSPGLGGTVGGIVVHTVTKRTPVTISVTYGRRTLTTAPQVLVPPADPVHPTGSLSLQDGGTVFGNSFLQLDLRLDAPAPTDGLPVLWRVRDDDPAASIDSPSGFVGEGFTTDSTFVTTSDVTTTHTVVLEAVVGETVFTLPMTIQPRVTDIVVPQTVVGGQPFTGVVSLAGPATVDTVVSLQSSWGIVDVQPEVTIPAGQTSATFTGSTVPVDTDSPVFISGFYGDGQSVQSLFMTVTP